ncbi:hypothetical protein CO709_06045 [Burkholderia thailandensis]|nr:hypothetical protein CO709_06045 [Burkholderia thailandensis]
MSATPNEKHFYTLTCAQMWSACRMRIASAVSANGNRINGPAFRVGFFPAASNRREDLSAIVEFV